MTDGGTCGNCKHLGKEINAYPDDGPAIDIPTGYHECGLIQHTTGNYHNISKTAFVIDGSGYWAALTVKSDFGCNQWEPGD